MADETQIVWNNSLSSLPPEHTKVNVRYKEWLNGREKTYIRLCTLEKFYNDPMSHYFKWLWFFVPPFQSNQTSLELVGTEWSVIDPPVGGNRIVLTNSEGKIYVFGTTNNLILLK
ncbi:hypothetical protein MA9V2_002 [Chryseobacterium phage MA9V-2]|nr:hypothetical protein MA9V2_002 [Chryseobacterium phage MA9V-2]